MVKRKSKCKPTCSVPGCGKEITARRLMCWDHWSALPMALQKSITETWKRDGRAKVQPALDGAVSMLVRRASREDVRISE